MTIFQVQGLIHDYVREKQTFRALNGITLNLPQGKLICISGPSGSGKTTLMSLLGLIEPMKQGEIILRDQRYSTMNESAKTEVRRKHIGFIFQRFHLFDVLTAEENVSFMLGRMGIGRSEIKERCRLALEDVGIWDMRHKRPPELSGGQCQRVAIARALAKRPTVILGDEPTSSLDSKNASIVLDIFTELVRKGLSVVVSSHDKLVMDRSEIHVSMKDGSLC